MSSTTSFAANRSAGHPLVVKRFKTTDEIAGCNILFIGRSEAPRIERTLQALRGRHVLTVTDFTGAEATPPSSR